MKKLSKEARDLFHDPQVKELLKNNDITEFIFLMKFWKAPEGKELLGALVELGVILPHMGRYIPEDWFEALDITEVKIPANIDSIWFGAFRNCKNLQKVYFEDRGDKTAPIRIDSRAFFECTSLTEVILPNTEVTFKSNVFERCRMGLKLYAPDISKIKYPKNEERWYQNRLKEI